MHAVTWLNKPQDHDFPAAADYLDLVADPQEVTTLTDRLRGGTLVHKKAKDLLRAAQLPLLPVDNPHVVADLAKVKKGQPLSPILAVRGGGECAGRGGRDMDRRTVVALALQSARRAARAA